MSRTHKNPSSFRPLSFATAFLIFAVGILIIACAVFVLRAGWIHHTVSAAGVSSEIEAGTSFDASTTTEPPVHQ